MTQSNTINQQIIDEIADGLQQHGFILLHEFLPDSLANQLYHEAKRLSVGAFKPAGIGRNNTQLVDLHVRTDSTLWLSNSTLTQQCYLDWMEQLRLGLNRRLFMGLDDFECHFSHYAKGQFYKRHLDAFQRDFADKRSHRYLSTVFYLNPHWQESDEGELLLFTEDQLIPFLTVPPVLNSCLLFLSESFPHEVLVSQTDRYSIAGWYRKKGQNVSDF